MALKERFANGIPLNSNPRHKSIPLNCCNTLMSMCPRQFLTVPELPRWGDRLREDVSDDRHFGRQVEGATMRVSECPASSRIRMTRALSVSGRCNFRASLICFAGRRE